METQPQPSRRTLINKYSPIVEGREGIAGAALKAVAWPVEISLRFFNSIGRFPIAYGYENTAGQEIDDCGYAVANTFANMEKKLAKGFKAATSRSAGVAEREKFLTLAEEVRADAAVLEKFSTIKKAFDSNVLEKYRFTLIKEPLGNKQYAITTLEEGIATVKEMLEASKTASSEATAAAVDKGAAGTLVVRKPLVLQKQPYT